MLILARLPGQTIVIGEGPDKITVTVAGVQGSQVKLAIHASPDIPVHRQEIYERIQQEKAVAAGLTKAMALHDDEPNPRRLSLKK